VLGNEPRHASGLRTSDTGQTPGDRSPETTHLTPACSCEACSAFTRVAPRTLAPLPICDLLHRRLQPFRHLHDCSGCFRLERSPGGALTHWNAPPSHGARNFRSFAGDSTNGANRPFAALRGRPYERTVSARKRSSAEGVGLRQDRMFSLGQRVEAAVSRPSLAQRVVGSGPAGVVLLAGRQRPPPVFQT
jgi:hypothetical protein